MSGESAILAGDQAPSTPRLPPAPGRVRARIMAILVLALPLFGQTFHYMKDLMPLWALSKALPLLSLPLAAPLFRQPRLPMVRQVLATFLWLVLVPSFVATFTFGQDFFTGITAQVKLLPMLYVFSFLGFLMMVKPTLRELTAAFLTWGFLTFALLVLLWALVPQNWYSGVYAFGSSPLFSMDNRGNRIRMPMYFGIITIFYCYRRFLGDRSLVWLFGALAGFLLTLLVVKTRAMIVGIAGVVVIDSFAAAGALTRVALLFAAPAGLVGLFSFGYLATMFSVDSSTGFDVRWKTITKAIDFLGVDPLRWLFGVGTISPTSADSLFSYFDHFFFLADITWLGIIFEFGLIGAILILFYELRGLLFCRQLMAGIGRNTFIGSLRDYILYVIIISNLYPPTLTPGETAVILAIFVYVWRSLAQDAPEDDA
jgi:hypothetical protein